MEANNYTLQNHNSNLIRREEFGKPVIFIDSKPVKDAETVISECEALISLIHQNGTSSSQYVLSSSQSNNNSFQMFHPQTKAIKNRTHSAYAISMYDKLQPKIFDAEKILRGLLLVIIDKKAVLRTQAKQIVTRLIACIDYQTNLLIKSDTPIQELRDVVNDLANESASVKTMVAFNFELLRLHTAQSARQGKTVLSWARKKNANQGPSDEDLAKDYEHRELHHRLHQLRSLREQVVFNLTHHLEMKEMVSQTIDSYNSIRIQLQSFLRIDPLTPVSTAPMPTDTDANSGVNGISKRKSKISKHAAVDSTGTFTTSDSCDGSPGSASSDSFDKFGSTCSSPVPGKHYIQTNHSDIYDHSRCTDCCLSQTLAIDCIEHLSTLDAQAMETSRCLRTLVETREKMRDIVECSDNDSESVSYALPPTSIFSSGAGQGMFRNTGSVRKDGLEGGRESSGMNTHSSTQNHSASVESTRSSILPSLNIVSSFGNFISSVYDDFSSQASGPSTQSHGPSTVGSGGGIGQHQHTASGARSLRSSRSSTGSFTDRSVETERSRGSARISGVNINLNTNGVASSGGGNNGVSFSTSPDPSFIGISSSGLRSDNNSNGSHAYTRVHPTSVNSSTAQNSSAAASPANAGSTNSLSLLTETNIKALQQIQIQTHHLADQRRSRPPSVASSASSASSSSSIKSRSRSMSTTSKESASSTTSSASRKSGKCSTDGSSKDNRERAVSAANSMASKVESKLISQQLAQQLETIHIRKKLSVDDSMPERLPASPTAPWSDIPISIIPRTRSLSNDGKDMAYSGNKLSPSHTPIRAGVMGSGYYHSPVYSAASMPRDSMSIYAKNQLSPTSKDEV